MRSSLMFRSLHISRSFGRCDNAHLPLKSANSCPKPNVVRSGRYFSSISPVSFRSTSILFTADPHYRPKLPFSSSCCLESSLLHKREMVSGMELNHGQLLDGKLIAQDIQKQIAEKSAELKHTKNVVPGLAIVQVGDRSDSNVYIRTKVKTAGEVGINAQHVKLPRDVSEVEVIQKIKELNESNSVHGIIVQLPLDCCQKIDASKVTDTILPEKDVDGLHTANAGHLLHGELNAGPLPCTPRGCLELIRRTGVKIEGARAVVLGRSKIVGSPMAQLLTWNHATVTVCHSKTKDLPGMCREADILVVAIGKANFVHGDWIKPGAVVIDCGINVVSDDTAKNGRRIVGDVEFESAKRVASYITPVPGGVGPMTVAMLLQNTLDSAQRLAGSQTV